MHQHHPPPTLTCAPQNQDLKAEIFWCHVTQSSTSRFLLYTGNYILIFIFFMFHSKVNINCLLPLVVSAGNSSSPTCKFGIIPTRKIRLHVACSLGPTCTPSTAIDSVLVLPDAELRGNDAGERHVPDPGLSQVPPNPQGSQPHAALNHLP